MCSVNISSIIARASKRKSLKVLRPGKSGHKYRKGNTCSITTVHRATGGRAADLIKG
jgi:hypothetical protein